MRQAKQRGRGGPPLLDSGFWILVALAATSTVAAVAIKGTGGLAEGGQVILRDLKVILPQITLGITVGVLFSVLVPSSVISRYLGEQSGVRGILLAQVFGMLMPGGPFTSFPLVAALGRLGAGIGPLMSFLVGWEAVGLHRMMVWELPFMGGEFALLRLLSCLPLPFLAGFLAMWLARKFPGIRPEFHG
ncbi:permease [Frigidibacter sp. ROC022]|uniref:permease n=1 Tax=Frigidibacter sp. ROC022 TaxID=2971796 RepID=UPI00215A68FF|nr:permease [Frigidibacter sp. ROC022]MCR8724536.1 permease [Frigidibacter sp. ROC022]